MKITLEIVNQTVLLHKEFETPTLHRIFFEILKFVFLSEVSHGSSCDYFALKTQILQCYYYFLAAGNKKFQWVKCDYAYDANDANESTRRLVKDGMSTGLTNKDTAHGFSVLYQVFGRKQCSLCSALRHKSYLTLPSRFILPWNFRPRLYSAAASQPRVFARLLIWNNWTKRVFNGIKPLWDEAAFPKLWIFFFFNIS